MNAANIFILTIFGGVYFWLKSSVNGAELLLWPVTLLTAFLHELGHAAGAVLTGGKVSALQIGADGSGFTRTLGGHEGFILMGGYIGSALLGNLLLYIGATRPAVCGHTLRLLAAVMIFSGVIWYQSELTTAILLLFALLLMLLARAPAWSRLILMFLGLATVLTILEDYRVGPSSDLARYTELFPSLSQSMWMIIWLAIAAIIGLVNLRLILGHAPPPPRSMEMAVHD